MKTITIGWGLIPYSEAWSRRTEWSDALVHTKQDGGKYENRITFREHPHVYTPGRGGEENNMLLGEERLKAIGATLYHIDRGDDITYHGPGQLVCYPILNLEKFGLGLKEYVYLLKEAVIRIYTPCGVEAGRLGKATGVWLESDMSRARRTCAVGVRSNHYVTMYGLALNMSTDLRYSSYARPCGLAGEGVTPLQKELEHNVDMDEVKEKLGSELLTFLLSE